MNHGEPSKTGIIGAMDEEVATLIASLTEERAQTVAGMVFHEGRLDGTDVVVVRCNVGKVNAAMRCAAVTRHIVQQSRSRVPWYE